MLIITATQVGCETQCDKKEFYITKEHQEALLEFQKSMRLEYDKIKPVYAKLVTQDGFMYERIAFEKDGLNEEICDTVIYKVITSYKVYYLYNIWPNRNYLSGTSIDKQTVEIHDSYVSEKQHSIIINEKEVLEALSKNKELNIDIEKKKTIFLKQKFPDLSREQLRRIKNHVF